MCFQRTIRSRVHFATTPTPFYRPSDNVNMMKKCGLDRFAVVAPMLDYSHQGDASGKRSLCPSLPLSLDACACAHAGTGTRASSDWRATNSTHYLRHKRHLITNLDQELVRISQCDMLMHTNIQMQLQRRMPHFPFLNNTVLLFIVH